MRIKIYSILFGSILYSLQHVVFLDLFTTSLAAPLACAPPVKCTIKCVSSQD